MKLVKIVGYVLGAVVLILVIGAIAVSMLFDAKTLKAGIEQAAKEKTGRTLKLEGDVKLAFWPSVGATLGRVQFSEKGSEREFLSLESGHVSVALMPLFKGETRVDAVRVAGLKANIVKHADGKFNFDDLLHPGEAKPAAKGAAPKSEPSTVKFDVSSVRFERSNLSYMDERTGQSISVENLDLQTGRIADGVPGKMTLSAAVKGKNPATDVRVKLSTGYTLSLEAGAYSFSGLDLSVAGIAAGISGLVATVKGDVAANLSTNEYSASGFSLDAKGAMGKDSFSAKLGAPKLSITANKAAGDAVSADLSMKSGERTVDAKLKLAGVQGSSKALSVASIVADVSIAAPDLPQKSVKLPITGSARGSLDKENFSADLVTKFDDSNIKARLGLTSFTPPAVVFDVSVDKLDLDRYMPPKSAGQSASKGAAPDAPVDLSGLKAVNASGKLHVSSLVVNRLQLSELRADVRLNGGRAEISPLAANLYGGTMSGALIANANGNQIAVKQNLANVSVGPIVKALAERDAIDGKGNVTLDVTAAGATVNAIRKSLGGSARVVLQDGAIKGFDLAETLRKTKAMLGSKSAQQQQAQGGQKTDFSEMSASFVIKGGVAHNEDLDAKAPLFRLGGAGDIDIGNSNLNYLAKASIVASAKGQGGGGLDHVAGLTVPVKLSGPFDAVKYEIDYGSLAASAAKSKVTDILKEKLGGKPAEGAAAPAGGSGSQSTRDKLRGLFGR